MKILILSCNTGGGHNAAAFALKESLEFHHHEAEVLDLIQLGRKHTSALVGGAYVKLVSVFPAGFGAVYQLGELVISTGADILSIELLAGALLDAVGADATRKETWRKSGASFFRGDSARARKGAGRSAGGASPDGSSAQPPAGEADAA